VEYVKEALRTLCETLKGELIEKNDESTCKVPLPDDKEIRIETRTYRKSPICSLISYALYFVPDEISIPGVAK